MQKTAPALTVLQTPAEMARYFSAVKDPHFVVRFPSDASALLGALAVRFKRERPPCYLSFRDSHLTPEDARTLCDVLFANANIYKVDLSNQNADVLNKVFPAISKVHALDLSFSAFDYHEFVQAHTADLEQLIIQGICVSGYLARRCVEIKALRHLDMSFCELESAAVEELLNIDEMDFLGVSNVVFKQSPFVGEFLHTICSRCAYVDLQGTYLTDAGCEAAIEGCLSKRGFCYLNICGCVPHMTDRMQQMLGQLGAKSLTTCMQMYEHDKSTAPLSACYFMYSYLLYNNLQTEFYVSEISVAPPCIQHPEETVKMAVRKLYLRSNEAPDIRMRPESLNETMRRSDLLYDNVLELDHWYMDTSQVYIYEMPADELSWDFKQENEEAGNQMIATLRQSYLYLTYGQSCPEASQPASILYKTPRSGKGGVTFCDFESKSPKASFDGCNRADNGFLQKARQLYADSPGADMAQIAELLRYYHACEHLDEAIGSMDYPRTKENYNLAKTEEDGFPAFYYYKFTFGVAMRPEDVREIKLQDHVEFKVYMDEADQLLSIDLDGVSINYRKMYFDSGLEYNVEVGSKVVADIRDFFNSCSFVLREEDTNYFRQVMSVRCSEVYSMPDCELRESVLWQIGGM